MAALALASPLPLSPIISNSAAVVEWSDIASRPRIPRYLAGSDPSAVQLNLLFNEEQNTVSLKIRVRLYFEQASGDERKEYVYICVHPDNVHLLLQCPPRPLPEGIAAAVRGPTAYLRLVLNKPVAVLAPLDAPAPLRSTRSSLLLHSIEELSRQTVLGIHLGQHAISDSDLVRRICDAFTDGSIIQHPRHDSLGDFYRGRGAGVVQQFAGFVRSGGENTGTRTVEEDNVDGNGGHGASPPPYPETRELPPPSLFVEQKKRKRSPEDQVSLSKRRQASPESSDTIHQVVSNVGAELLAHQKKQMTKFISWQQSQMAEFVEKQQAVFARMDRVVQGMESRIMERVEEHLLDESIAIEANLERGKENLKCELRHECIEELREVLEDGLVSITLPR